MELAVKSVDNASAEIAAAAWPLIRIAAVDFKSAATPQNNTHFTIPWGAVTSRNIGGFSGACYYFGRRMFQELASGGDAVPIGLVEQAVGGTYIHDGGPHGGLQHNWAHANVPRTAMARHPTCPGVVLMRHRCYGTR